MSYTHLTSTERGQIQAYLEEGRSMNYIARMLGRSPSTISRELERNGTREKYEAAKAQRAYEERRKACRPCKRLEYLPLWRYVFDKIPSKWTPEQIAGRLPLDYPHEPRMRISHEALYQNLYAEPRLHCLIKELPQARPKRRKRGQGKTRRGPSIPNRVGIKQRPAEVETRITHGHWEGDLIVGKNNDGFLVTLVERTSRLLCAVKTQTKKAGEVAHAIIEVLLDYPASWLKSVTLDNGTEFALHERIAQTLPVQVYFADPYAAYQRGTNENTNGLIRRYLPKGTSFAQFTQRQLDTILEEINNRPKKCLGYRTPYEVFQKIHNQRLIALGS